MKIGVISGYDVIYDDSVDMVYCKHVEVSGTKLVAAWDSSFDRVSLGPNLVMRKRGNDVTLGCLALTNEIAEQIKQKINGRTTRTTDRLTEESQSV